VKTLNDILDASAARFGSNSVNWRK